MRQVGREMVLQQMCVCLRSCAEQHLADGWQLCWKISWLWDFERSAAPPKVCKLNIGIFHFCDNLEKAYLKEMQ